MKLPPISVVPDHVMRYNRASSLNRLCNLRDWESWDGLSKVMNELNDCVTIHRKAWEYAICIDGLQRLGAVIDTAEAIAVGAGYERPLYYFANRIKRMVATDLYDNPSHEGKPEMLNLPESFAPFPYRKDHLEVRAMSALQLEFESCAFDFAFCLSSIEHFGTRDQIRIALDEMIRVVRPGGHICIITELLLAGGSHPEYFRPDEIEDIFLNRPDLEIVGGDFDLRIQESLFKYPIDIEHPHAQKVAPQIVLLVGDLMITSLSMFFKKSA